MSGVTAWLMTYAVCFCVCVALLLLTEHPKFGPLIVGRKDFERHAETLEKGRRDLGEDRWERLYLPVTLLAAALVAFIVNVVLWFVVGLIT